MYFSLIPDIKQPVRPISFPFSESEYITAKNFFRRYQVNPDIFEYAVYFTKYAIEEGDRLDNIAEKIYGNPFYDWVIVLTNSMINPQFSMPFGDQTVIKIAEEKYGLDGAYSGIHHYETLEYKTPSGTVLQEAGLIVDKNFYQTSHQFNDDVGFVTVPGNQLSKSVTNLEYEYQENEKKREIYVLRGTYLTDFVNEFKRSNKYPESSSYINSRLKESN
jgi:hypothetical protein